jgi:hypothetical protein
MIKGEEGRSPSKIREEGAVLSHGRHTCYSVTCSMPAGDPPKPLQNRGFIPIVQMRSLRLRAEKHH